jgi:hypothetical protein
MIDAYLSDMVGFFEEIARPGWSGSARWQSEFSEVTVEAKHAPDDLVRLSVSVWWKDGDELDNERRGELLIRAAEVSNFAAGLRELTGLHGPADRFRPA